MKEKPSEPNLGRHFIKDKEGELILLNELQVRDAIPPEGDLGPHFKYDKNGNIVSKQSDDADNIKK